MTQPYKLSRYVVLTDLIDGAQSDDPSRILFATRTGKTMLIKDRVLQALQRNEFEGVEERILASLLEHEVLVPSAQDEFAEILERNVLATEDTTTLAVTVQPTANCQLGCTYCGQVHSKKNVDEETSLKITNRIIHNLQKKNYKAISIQWFGAEPLMAHKEIIRMSERLIDFCTSNNVAYNAHMITNGMSFKPAIFLKMLEQKIRQYQITLDGIGETHDIMRISKEGKKTFEIIFGNIVEVTSLPEFVENKCEIAVRVNVNKSSSKTVFKLIDRLAEHGVQHRGVTIDFAPIVDWGGNAADQYSLTKDEFANAEIDWILYAMQKGFHFDRVIPGRTPAPCMTVQKDGEVYDVSGNVYPCYEYPYTPKYEGAEYKIGHLDTIDTVKNDHAITRDWFVDVKADIAPCKTCNLFPVCGGGCPKQWYNKDIACPSFKANIEDKLVMHYLMRKDDHLQEHLKTAVIR